MFSSCFFSRSSKIERDPIEEARQKRTSDGLIPDTSQSEGRQGIFRQHSGIPEDSGLSRSLQPTKSKASTTRRRSKSFLNPEDGSEAEKEEEVPLTPHEMSLLFLPAHWKFKDKIGSGAFGSVWLGTFKPNNHTYAVKKVFNQYHLFHFFIFEKGETEGFR